MSEGAAVRLSGLYATDELGAVHSLTLDLPAGALGALLGSPADGTTALARALCGSSAPQGGQIAIAGAAPFSTPELRSRIGVLLDEPELPDVGRVRDLLVFARMLRETEAPRDEWYEALRMGELGRLEVRELPRQQRRTVALALALAVASPALLVLHEPLCDVLYADARWLGALLRRRAEQGACVLVLTASVRDATTLVDDVATLQKGRIGRAIGAPDLDELTPGSEVELQVWSDMPRALASALVLEPSIRSVEWNAKAGSPVVVRSADVDAAAGAVARIASSNGVVLQAIRPVVPSLGEVNAATAGMAHAARYQAAIDASARATHARGDG